MCMHVCMHVCMYVYVWMYVRMHVCMCVYMYCMCVRMSVCLSVCLSICMYAYTYLYVCTHVLPICFVVCAVFFCTQQNCNVKLCFVCPFRRRPTIFFRRPRKGHHCFLRSRRLVASQRTIVLSPRLSAADSRRSAPWNVYSGAQTGSPRRRSNRLRAGSTVGCDVWQRSRDYVWCPRYGIRNVM